MKTVVEQLNEIANVLGDENPDVLNTETQALESIITQLKNGGGGGGGGSSIMNVTMTNEETPKLDATWQQIHDTFQTGLVLVRSEVTGLENQLMCVQNVWEEDSNSFCLNVLRWVAGTGMDAIPFISRTSDGYPEWDL